MPILDGAQEALEALYASALDINDDAPVFATIERKPGRDGIMRPVGRPLSPRMVTRVFRRYAARACLPDTIRLHDLRHTAITNAIGQGEDILLVSAFAGHAKTSTTVDVYGHLMPDRVREAAKRMHSISGPSRNGTQAAGQQQFSIDRVLRRLIPGSWQPTIGRKQGSRLADRRLPSPASSATWPRRAARPSRRMYHHVSCFTTSHVSPLLPEGAAGALR